MNAEAAVDTTRLRALLDEALAIADGLDLTIVAIHIDQALAQIGRLATTLPAL